MLVAWEIFNAGITLAPGGRKVSEGVAPTSRPHPKIYRGENGLGPWREPNSIKDVPPRTKHQKER